METCEILEQLGFDISQKTTVSSLEELWSAGLSSPDYRDLVRWLADTIKQYVPGIDESVVSVDESHSFAMEISSFLKELGCPYHSLVEGPISARYRSENDSKLLVDFLAEECIAGIIGQHKRNEELKHRLSLSPDTPLDSLMQIFQKLQLDTNIEESQIFDEINNRLDELVSNGHVKPELLYHPNGNLSEAQWAQLNQCHAELQEEYNLRRRMMMERLDVTMLGFLWKADTKLEVGQVWRQKKRNLSALEASLKQKDISNLLVAEQNLLTIEKVASTRIKGNKKNVFQGILTLPNRGGIVSIDAKPHMPIWSSREEGLPTENLRKKQPKPAKHQHATGKKSKKK